MPYEVRPLNESTWQAFAELVERKRGSVRSPRTGESPDAQNWANTRG